MRHVEKVESWYFSCVFFKLLYFLFLLLQIMSRGKSLNNFFCVGSARRGISAFPFQTSHRWLSLFFFFAFEGKAAATASRFLLGDVRDFLFRREFIASIWISFFCSMLRDDDVDDESK